MRLIVLLTLPVVGFVALELMFRWFACPLMIRAEKARSLGKLSPASCPKCGVKIGEVHAAQLIADDFKSRRQLLANAEKEGYIVHLDPRWQFFCPVCKSPLMFDPENGALEPDPCPEQPASPTTPDDPQ